MRSRPGTITLVFLLLAVFLVEIRAGAVRNDAGLLGLGALPDTGELQNQYWRFLTFGFLHFNITHLLLNTALLLWMGRVVERHIGALYMVAVFLASSVASGIAILLKHQLHPATGASIGASGGVFGLLGAALVLLSRRPPASVAQRNGLLVLIALGFAYSFIPGVSMVGHVIGFLVGISSAALIPIHPAPSVPDGAGA